MTKWTQSDAARAGKMGWMLRPWRYVPVDGCWTICRTYPSPINSYDEAVRLVLRLGATRDFCENEKQWETCNKAARMAAGFDANEIEER